MVGAGMCELCKVKLPLVLMIGILVRGWKWAIFGIIPWNYVGG
jgi:hypothetical protein